VGTLDAVRRAEEVCRGCHADGAPIPGRGSRWRDRTGSRRRLPVIDRGVAARRRSRCGTTPSRRGTCCIRRGPPRTCGGAAAPLPAAAAPRERRFQGNRGAAGGRGGSLADPPPRRSGGGTASGATAASAVVAAQGDPLSVSRLVVGDDGYSAAAAARSWGERLAAATDGDVDVVRDVERGGSAAAGPLARPADRADRPGPARRRQVSHPAIHDICSETAK
jgi:hypothetical protein